jgi:flagellar basal-body rod protein FlgG
MEVAIDPEGRVNVRTAGSPETTTQLGQLQLHRFVNPSGMLAVGNNVLRPTEASGQAITGNPGQIGLGSLRSGFLERSNVQIVNELVNLIVAQRAYEVNSRAIQASDQMLSTATNIGR